MDDVLYPDNPKRRDRVSQLANDCMIFQTDLANRYDELDLLVRNMNDTIVKFVEKYKLTLETTSKPSFQFDAVVLWAVSSIEPFVVYPTVTKCLTKASVSFLLKQGRIGEAAFSSLVGLPSWFKVGTAAGGLLVVVGLQAITSAISGAIGREKARENILELIPPRRELKKNLVIMGIIIGKIHSLKTAMEMIDSSNLGLTDHAVNAMTQTSLNAMKQEIDAITDDQINEMLAKFDQRRDAWTSEDQ